MAVSFVGNGSIVTNVGDCSPAIPAGANGELLILIAHGGTDSNMATPSGWSLYQGFPQSSSAGGGKWWLLTRIRDGSEGSTVLCDFSGTISQQSAVVVSCSGHNSSFPLGVASVRGDGKAPGQYIPGDALLFAIGAQLSTNLTAVATLSGDGLTWAEAVEDGSMVVDYATPGSSDVAMSAHPTWVPTTGSITSSLSFTVTPSNKQDRVIVSTGAGNITAPASTTAVQMHATGGGGGGSVTTSAEGSGAGGGYARTNSVAVTGGSSIVYYSVGTGGGPGANGGASWARVGTNSAPSSTTDGVSAREGGGGSASGQGGGLAQTTGFVGDVSNQGGNGVNGQGGGGSRAGSGGGQAGGPNATGTAGTAGSGSTAGTGGNGSSLGGAGGNGGGSGATGLSGVAPGGGGGGGGNSGGNAGSGARGEVRLIFTISAPTVGRGDETDTAFKAGGIAMATQRGNETDTASAIFPKVVLATQRPIETDTAFNRGTTLQPQRANETDLAFALSQGIVQLPVGQANETDSAFKAGGIGMAPNRPIETDTASTRGVVLQVQRANETDQALQLDRLGGVGLAIETDTAFALGKLFILPVGRAPVANGDFSSNYLSEYATFNSSISVVAGRLRVTANNTSNVMATATFPSIGAALGVGNVVRVQGEGFAGTANAVVRFRNGATGLASQTNTAFDLQTILTENSVKIDATLNDLGAVSVGQFAEFDNFIITTWPREVDTAFALNRLDTPAWTRSNETDSAFALVPGFPASRSNETDLAFARTGVIIRVTQRADEVNTAFARNPGVFIPVARADEINTASRLGFGSPAVPAIEADTAFARNALITIDHGFSQETDTAFQMFGALSAGSGRKPHLRFDRLLRDRIQPVYKGQ